MDIETARPVKYGKDMEPSMQTASFAPFSPGTENTALLSPPPPSTDTAETPDSRKVFDWLLFGALMVWLPINIGLSSLNGWKSNTNWQFWASFIGKIFIMLGACMAGGFVVDRYKVKVNYTRKTQHFAAYFTPFLLNLFIKNPYVTLVTTLWDYWTELMCFAVLIEPFRKHSKILRTMYKAIDRPEDWPNTLLWLTTQIFCGYVILVLFGYFIFDPRGQHDLILIPILITGIGDGLAEPVGIRFGKHKYQTRALCSSRKYTRSYEGSSCVLIVGFISVAILYRTFNNLNQFLAAFFVVPVVMTLVEAYSPHTWDAPTLLGSGCGLLALIIYVL